MRDARDNTDHDDDVMMMIFALWGNEENEDGKIMKMLTTFVT